VTKKIPKGDNHEEEVIKIDSKDSEEETKKGDSSLKGTPSAYEKTKSDRKRKQVDRLEG
jgi:hypothetical protein